MYRDPVGHRIKTLNNLMKRAMDKEFGHRPDRATLMHTWIIGFLQDREDANIDTFQKDIEEEFRIRKSTATGILQLMEKNGFISRESSKKDARLKRIVPTPKAEALRPEILEHIRDTEKRLIQGIDQEDVKICRKVLVQMIQNLAENKTENKEEDENDE